MARCPRYLLLGDGPATIHFIWRCHNRDFLLTDHFKDHYLRLLARCKGKYGIKIYGYAAMDNHFHAVLWIPSRSHWERFSRTVNSALAMSINRHNKRCGQVVMDRPRTIVLERDEDALAALRYIDMNPVRAGMVRRARDYRWSSYRCHGHGERSDLIDPCPGVLALGRTAVERHRAYVSLFGGTHASANHRRRPDLVDVPFVGNPVWVTRRLQSLRPARPSRAGPSTLAPE